MNEKITLKGEQGKIEIDLLHFEQPNPLGVADDDWITSRMKIEVPPFSGDFEISLVTGEVKHFRDALAPAVASLSGNVSFENLENDFSLQIEFDGHGGALIKATAGPHGPLGPVLTFRLKADQSCLRETLRDLDRAIKKFGEKPTGAR